VGATLVPLAVILLHGAFVVAAYALVSPLADAATALFDELGGDPTLVAVFTSPWAFVLLIDLAVVAPLGEEILKPLGARLLRPQNRPDAFLLGAAAGAGFAAIENILYSSGWLLSSDAWIPISVLRSSGAALHLLGAGLISVAIFEVRSGHAPRWLLLKTFGIAAGLHALWNGTIAVSIILFNERYLVGEGLTGSAFSWGLTLDIILGAFGVLMLGGLFVAGRWAKGDGGLSILAPVSFARPTTVAAWAALAVLMLVPATILVLAFPGYLAL
jgi:hypothetical protein